jgi:hypothetical protein
LRAKLKTIHNSKFIIQNYFPAKRIGTIIRNRQRLIFHFQYF